MKCPLKCGDIVIYTPISAFIDYPPRMGVIVEARPCSIFKILWFLSPDTPGHVNMEKSDHSRSFLRLYCPQDEVKAAQAVVKQA